MQDRRTGGRADGRADTERSTAKGSEPNLFKALLATIRRLAGMPDYAGHVNHLRRCHPERPVPTPRQFYEDFVRARYGDGPTRCC